MDMATQFLRKAENSETSTEELKQLLDEMLATKLEASELIHLSKIIAAHPHSNDDIIELTVDSLLRVYISGARTFESILNNGSKELFDRLWNDKKTKFGKGISHSDIFMSKHADEKQLEEEWKRFSEYRGPMKNRNLVVAAFFQHPNIPQKILNRNLKSVESLQAMASNPNLQGKAFEAVCDYAKVMRHDELLIKLLNNKSLDWKKIADGIDLKEQVTIAFGSGGILTASDKRVEAIANFFKRSDAPEKARMIMFEITKDPEFLPDAIRDTFLF